MGLMGAVHLFILHSGPKESKSKEPKFNGKSYLDSNDTSAPIGAQDQGMQPFVTINARRKLGVYLPIPVAVILETVAKLHVPCPEDPDAAALTCKI